MPKKTRDLPINEQLAKEAKSIVAIAFRNGTIENIHAGKECPQCAGQTEYSHITQGEMKKIMKQAVDKVYALLWIRTYTPVAWESVVRAGERYTHAWDMPEQSRKEIEGMGKLADFLGK